MTTQGSKPGTSQPGTSQSFLPNSDLHRSIQPQQSFPPNLIENHFKAPVKKAPVKSQEMPRREYRSLASSSTDYDDFATFGRSLQHPPKEQPTHEPSSPISPPPLTQLQRKKPTPLSLSQSPPITSSSSSFPPLSLSDSGVSQEPSTPTATASSSLKTVVKPTTSDDSSISPSTVIKLNKVGVYTITISGKNIFAEGNGNRYKVEIFQGSDNITENAVADKEHVKILVEKVCNTLAKNGLLNGSYAKMSISGDQIEMTGYDPSTNSSSPTATEPKIIKSTDKTISIALRVVLSGLKITKNNQDDNFIDLTKNGDCLPASLLQQMRGSTTYSKDRVQKTIREPVSNQLKDKNYRTSVIQRIKTDYEFEHLVRDSFADIQTNHPEIYKQLVKNYNNSEIDVDLLKINFGQIELGKLSPDVLDVLLLVYRDYIDYIDPKTGDVSYLNPLFLQFFVDVNKDPAMQIVVIQNKAAGHPENGQQIKYILSNPNKKLDDRNFDKVYFVYYTGATHYKSLKRNNLTMKQLVREHQDSILFHLLNIGVADGGESRVVSQNGIEKFISLFKQLQHQHPVAYNAIKQKIDGGTTTSSSAPPLGDKEVILTLETYLKCDPGRGVKLQEILKGWGITYSTIQSIVDKARDKPNPSKQKKVKT